MNVSDLKNKARQLRVDVLSAITKAGSGFSGSCMSVIEILTALYYGDISGRAITRQDPKRPDWEDQDYIILSKGHTVPVQYAILADLGFFEKKELDYMSKPGALLTLRANKKIPGITLPAISPGTGISLAVGLALALKMDRKQNKVYVVMGDAELQEGQVWEALLTASYYQLNNLIVLIDNNGYQSEGPLKAVMNVDPINLKFEAFNWKVIPVADGHDFDQILDALFKAYATVRQPACLICKTVLGQGITFAEGKEGYHSVPLSEAELKDFIDQNGSK